MHNSLLKLSLSLSDLLFLCFFPSSEERHFTHTLVLERKITPSWETLPQPRECPGTDRYLRRGHVMASQPCSGVLPLPPGSHMYLSEGRKGGSEGGGEGGGAGRGGGTLSSQNEFASDLRDRYQRGCGQIPSVEPWQGECKWVGVRGGGETTRGGQQCFLKNSTAAERHRPPTPRDRWSAVSLCLKQWTNPARGGDHRLRQLTLDYDSIRVAYGAQGNYLIKGWTCQ